MKKSVPEREGKINGPLKPELSGNKLSWVISICAPPTMLHIVNTANQKGRERHQKLALWPQSDTQVGKPYVQRPVAGELLAAKAFHKHLKGGIMLAAKQARGAQQQEV